jgi:hypothetical protein
MEQRTSEHKPQSAGASTESIRQYSSVRRWFESSGGSLWLWWVVATALAGIAGGATIRLGIGREGFAWLKGLGLCGLAVGLAQSIVLTRFLDESDRSLRIRLEWGFACLVGCVAGGTASSFGTYTLVLLLMFTMNVDYTWVYEHGGPVLSVTTLLLSATAVTALQRLVLRARFLSLRRWTYANVVGWSAGLATGWWIANATTGSAILQGAVGGATGGVVLGAITGQALVRLRVPRSTGFS